jgi:hypothetical protein
MIIDWDCPMCGRNPCLCAYAEVTPPKVELLNKLVALRATPTSGLMQATIQLESCIDAIIDYLRKNPT